MTKKLEEAQDVLLSKINQICNKFGLNNIMAQLYAVLYLCGKPLSLDDMVERLHISKGSASINIRALERYGAVRRVWIKGSRKDYYEAEPNITKVIVDRIRSMVQGRMSEMNDMIDSTYAAMNSVNSSGGDGDEETKIFKERLDKLNSLREKTTALLSLFESGFLNNLLAEKNFVESKKESVA